MVNFAKNQMETSKVTSKTSSLKALLLKAWCERWTDLHWGTQIKSVSFKHRHIQLPFCLSFYFTDSILI